MASIKSLFDAQCGTQAPLLSLSKNYAHTNSRVPSTSINKTATNLPNGFGSSADAVNNLNTLILNTCLSFRIIYLTSNVLHLVNFLSRLMHQKFFRLQTIICKMSVREQTLRTRLTCRRYCSSARRIAYFLQSIFLIVQLLNYNFFLEDFLKFFCFLFILQFRNVIILKINRFNFFYSNIFDFFYF